MSYLLQRPEADYQGTDLGACHGIAYSDRLSPAGLTVSSVTSCRWTNGRFKSTLHRVVNSNERFSTPFFLAANWDAEVHISSSTVDLSVL